MVNVICNQTDCIYNNGNECTKENITLDFGCEDYADYLDTAEYQEEYFIRVKACDGKEAKAVQRGKKIVFRGFTFYTRDHLKKSEIVIITEMRTGFNCGDFERLKNEPERWEKFISAVHKISDCANLPLTEYDVTTKQYEYIKTEG